MRDALAPDEIRAWSRLAAGALGRDRTLINDVNVFPVADGDTGTNMYLTLREAARAVTSAAPDFTSTRLLRHLARAALPAARGNSGVILAEWLRGLAAAATARKTLAQCLDEAARAAHLAVAHPAPGTFLTAAQGAAAAAATCADRPSATTDDILAAAVQGARDATIASVAELAPLARAGVLDAGACGLVLVLDALRVAPYTAAASRASTVQASSDTDSSSGSAGLATSAMLVVTPVVLGLTLTGYEKQADTTSPDDTHPCDHAHHQHYHDHHQHGDSDVDEFEVMFVLERPADAQGFATGEVATALRQDLASVGNSVVVVGGSALPDDDDGTVAPASRAAAVWQAHVHVPDLAAALAVAHTWAGRGTAQPAFIKHLAVPNATRALIASTQSPGIAAELARAGATVLVPLNTPVPPHHLADAAHSAGAHAAIIVAPQARATIAAVHAVAAERHGTTTSPSAVNAPPAADGQHATADLPDMMAVLAPEPDLGETDIAVIDAPTDAHCVVAVAALAALADLDTEPPATAPPIAETSAIVTQAMSAVTVINGDALETEPLDHRLTQALAATETLGQGCVVTACIDDDVPEAAIAQFNDVCAAADADLITIATLHPGTQILLAVEPVADDSW
ncbi:MAG: DAK2 domain-containing protein [Cellulomonadaceae bacterium]|jgi:hypothetical protein|nr:DAK2 domain-containing protein [Cellulomonadaceae bacterium]